ncbi:hypothetical protein [Mycobacterium angelicum]|uniref:hypothetical protein n=1 Tax=Mycobacterium angelicum TaxID=470074 RepID=UPI0014731DF2|nr:hypothetical protein [Mycobacterium angelicum]MCV7195306.1 hypothetical protein [Mycobacterium angelicum]
MPRTTHYRLRPNPAPDLTDPEGGDQMAHELLFSEQETAFGFYTLSADSMTE